MAPMRPLVRPVGTMPSKTLKVPPPKPGISVPRVVSQIAKVTTAAATGTPINRSQPVKVGGSLPSIALRGLKPKTSAPVVSGAMPRRVWLNPVSAQPVMGRPGAPQQSHMREVGRMRAITRNTR